MAVPEAKQYILDFENLGMGLFIHWGLYSQLGKGEWFFYHSDAPMDEYKKLKDTFTAEDFDAVNVYRQVVQCLSTSFVNLYTC